MPTVTLPSSDQLTIPLNGSNGAIQGEHDATTSKESEFSSLFLSMNTTEIPSEKPGKSASTEKGKLEPVIALQEEKLTSDESGETEAAESADDMISRLVSSREMAQNLKATAPAVTTLDANIQTNTSVDSSSGDEHRSIIAAFLHSEANTNDSDESGATNGAQGKGSSVSVLAKEIRTLIDNVRAAPAVENAKNTEHVTTEKGAKDPIISTDDIQVDESSESLNESVMTEQLSQDDMSTEDVTAEKTKPNKNDLVFDDAAAVSGLMMNPMLSMLQNYSDSKTASKMPVEDTQLNAKTASFEQTKKSSQAEPSLLSSIKSTPQSESDDAAPPEISEVAHDVVSEKTISIDGKSSTPNAPMMMAKDADQSTTAQTKTTDVTNTQGSDQSVENKGKEAQVKNAEILSVAVDADETTDALAVAIKESKDSGAIFFKPASEGVTPPHASLLEKTTSTKADASTLQTHVNVSRQSSDTSSSEQQQTEQQQSSQNGVLQTAAQATEPKHESSEQSAVFSLSQMNTAQPNNVSETANARVTPAQLQSVYVRNGELDEQMMANRVLMMVGQSLKEAELMLNPEGLGKIRVHLSMDQEQQTHVQFYAQNPNAKEIIEQSLPRLRDILSQNGVQPGQTQVQHQSSQQQGFAQQFAGQNMSHQQSNHHSGQSRAGNFAQTDAHIEQTISVSTSQDDGIDFYA